MKKMLLDENVTRRFMEFANIKPVLVERFISEACDEEEPLEERGGLPDEEMGEPEMGGDMPAPGMGGEAPVEPEMGEPGLEGEMGEPGLEGEMAPEDKVREALQALADALKPLGIDLNVDNAGGEMGEPDLGAEEMPGPPPEMPEPEGMSEPTPEDEEKPTLEEEKVNEEEEVVEEEMEEDDEKLYEQFINEITQRVINEMKVRK